MIVSASGDAISLQLLQLPLSDKGRVQVHEKLRIEQLRSLSAREGKRSGEINKAQMNPHGVTLTSIPAYQLPLPY